MSAGEAALTSPTTMPGGAATRTRGAVQSWELRRWLRLGLAAIWLLDGILQFQSFFFSRAFGSQFLAPLGAGNPHWVAQSITWMAHEISHHATPANALFAFLQVAIGIGIAWRPTVRVALGGSIAWALLVWWFGEGLGGLITHQATPLTGAPGAVLIYALLAVLLWPTRPHDEPNDSFVAARSIGRQAARIVWVVLWGGLAYLLVQPATRAPQGLHDAIAKLAAGEPSWLASVDNHVASWVAHRGLEVSVALAVVFAVTALAVFLPHMPRRIIFVVALVVLAMFWVVGQNFGGILSHAGTDPNAAPLMALLVAAYWPLAVGTATPAGS